MVNYLEYPEFVSLLSAASKKRLKTYALIALLGYTGLRISEALHLKVSMVMLNGTIPTSIQLPSFIAKNHRSREIFIPDPLLPILIRYLLTYLLPKPESTWLFPGSTGSPMTVRNAQIIISKLAYKTLHRRVTPHTLRHTYATLLARRAPIRVVQQALGHTSLSATQIYTHVTRSDVQSAVDLTFPSAQNQAPTHTAPLTSPSTPPGESR